MTQLLILCVHKPANIKIKNDGIYMVFEVVIAEIMAVFIHKL
jgi:hypothetical protein